MKRGKILLKLLRFISMVFVIGFGCITIISSGGGGGGSDDDGGDSNTNPPADEGTPLILSLNQGDYWDFYWLSHTNTLAEPDIITESTKNGRYRITLGSPKVISGVNSFPLNITGDATDGTKNMTPRWKYIGVNNDILVGSEDGVTLETIYDGSAANWDGGGFFISFASNETVTPVLSTFDGNYNDLSAILVGHETESGGCETILGETVCSDTSTNFTEKEYMKEGIGPLGYKLNIGYTSSSGGFDTSTNIECTIELVETNHTASDGSQIKEPPWSELADMNIERQDPIAVTLNDKIYVMGGWDVNSTALSSMEIYDPVNNSWTFGASMPVSIVQAAAVTYNGKIYVVKDHIYAYDPTVDSWTTGAVTTPFTDAAFDSVLYGNSIYNITPNGPYSGYLYTYYYNIESRQWLQGVSFARSDLRWFSTGLIQDIIYVTGGYQQGYTNKINNSLYAYNITSNTWSTLAGSMHQVRYSHEALALNNKLYVSGGRTVPEILNSMEAYDPGTDTWTELTPMFTPRYNFEMVTMAGKIYAIGGNDGEGAIKKCEVYIPELE